LRPAHIGSTRGFGPEESHRTYYLSIFVRPSVSSGKYIAISGAMLYNSEDE